MITNPSANPYLLYTIEGVCITVLVFSFLKKEKYCPTRFKFLDNYLFGFDSRQTLITRVSFDDVQKAFVLKKFSRDPFQYIPV